MSKYGAINVPLLLSFVIHSGKVIAIPRSGKAIHTKENAAASLVQLTFEDIADLSAPFPAPTHKEPLDMQ